MSIDKKSSSNELQSFEEPNTPVNVNVSKFNHYKQISDCSATSDQPRRINPDSHKMLWFAVGLVGFVGAISFMVSFSGLVAVAEWAGLPPAMRWAVPIFIDAAILVYSIAVLIHRSRGEKTWASWVSLGAFTLVSVLANVGHVLLMPERSADDFQTWIGALVAGMAPIGVFAATEELGRLAIQRPNRRQAREPEPVEVFDGSPTPSSPTTPPETETPAPVTESWTAVSEKDTAYVNVKELQMVGHSVQTPISALQHFATWPLEVNLQDLSLGHTHIPISTKDRATSARVHTTPVVSQGLDPDRSTSQVKDEISPAVPQPTMTSVRYLDPAAKEQQILDSLLAQYGKDLTAKHIADSLEKTVRTGQRKLAKIQTQRPDIFSPADQRKA